MAIDRQLKKRKKREEKQKARRQEVQRQQLHEKTEEYDWEAEAAFRAKDCKRSLFWAQKKLRLKPADSHMRGLALRCSQLLDDGETFYNLFSQSYQYGEQTTRHNCLILAEMAYTRKHYQLVVDVLEAVLSTSSPLTGRLPASRHRQAKYLYQICLPEARPPAEKPRSPKQPTVKEEVATAATSPTLSPSPAELAEEAREAVTALRTREDHRGRPHSQGIHVAGASEDGTYPHPQFSGEPVAGGAARQVCRSRGLHQ